MAGGTFIESRQAVLRSAGRHNMATAEIYVEGISTNHGLYTKNAWLEQAVEYIIKTSQD